MEATTTALKKLKSPRRDQFVYFLSKFFFSILTCTELYYFAAFLTDTALFSLAIVGLIQTATTVIDTIFSFFYGAMMEKIGDKMPWGSHRSWLLVGPPIITVLFIFCFVRVSENEMVSAIVIIVAFTLSHILWSIGEAAMNSMSVLMTDDVDERAAMSINLGRGTTGSSLIFGYVAGFFLNTLFVGNPMAYVYMIIIFGVLYCIGYWALFAISKGCEDDRPTKLAKAERAAKVAALSTRTATMGQAYKAVFSSKNTILMMLGILLSYCSMFLVSGTMYYFFAYAIDSAAMMGTFMSLRGLVGLLGGVFFTPLLLKLCKGNKKKAYLASCVIVVVTAILNFTFRGFMAYAVIALIGAFFGGGTAMYQVAMIGDCGVECSYKTNKDMSPFVVSFLSLPLKISLILKSVLITVALGMTGYVAGMAITDEIVNGFYVAYIIWPMVMNIILFVVMLFYKLPEDKVTEMIKENDRRAMEDQQAVEAALAKMEAQG